jgi:subtilisin-like proprotein convertase family protein
MKLPLAAVASALALVAAPAGATVYAGSGFTIGDLTTHSSTITVADTGTVSNVNFTLNGLSHTFIHDLVATLEHGGVTVDWLNFSDGGDDLNGDYTISDSGATTIGNGTGSPRPSGTYAALSSLSAFNGLSVTGDWTLTISDQVGFDSGNLNSWDLSLNSSTAVPEPATWMMMLLGFGAIGWAVRRQRKVAAALAV